MSKAIAGQISKLPDKTAGRICFAADPHTLLIKYSAVTQAITPAQAVFLIKQLKFVAAEACCVCEL